MLKATGELDRILDGRGLEFDPPAPHTTTVEPPRLGIPPPDWDDEERERLERERSARIAAARDELEALEEEPTKPTPPAAKQRRPWPKFS